MFAIMGGDDEGKPVKTNEQSKGETKAEQVAIKKRHSGYTGGALGWWKLKGKGKYKKKGWNTAATRNFSPESLSGKESI